MLFYTMMSYRIIKKKSYAYHTETNIDIVRQVLEDPKAYIEPGKHYVFSVGGAMQWHIISGMYIFYIKSNYLQQSFICAVCCYFKMKTTLV